MTRTKFLLFGRLQNLADQEQRLLVRYSKLPSTGDLLHHQLEVFASYFCAILGITLILILYVETDVLRFWRLRTVKVKYRI